MISICIESNWSIITAQVVLSFVENEDLTHSEYTPSFAEFLYEKFMLNIVLENLVHIFKNFWKVPNVYILSEIITHVLEEEYKFVIREVRLKNYSRNDCFRYGLQMLTVQQSIRMLLNKPLNKLMLYSVLLHRTPQLPVLLPI